MLIGFEGDVGQAAGEPSVCLGEHLWANQGGGRGLGSHQPITGTH